MFPDGVHGSSEVQSQITQPGSSASTDGSAPNSDDGLIIMWQHRPDSGASVPASRGSCCSKHSNFNSPNRLLKGDIDDEEFDSYFQSPKSQWQKEFEATCKCEEMFKQPSVSPLVQKNKMDQLFEEIVDFDKSDEVMESQAIRTPLLRHQRMALSWMTKRENNKNVAPFWYRTDTGYINQATLQSQTEKPESMKGGILADDMGLGKTLVVISLILGNHTNGEPMWKKAKKKLIESELDGRKLSIESDPIMEAVSLSKQPGHQDDYDDEVKAVKFKKQKEGYFKPQEITRKDMQQPGFKFRQLFLKEMKKNDKALAKMKKRKRKEKVVNEARQLKEVDNHITFSDSDEEMEKHNISKKIARIVNSPSLRETSLQNSSLAKRKTGKGSSTLIICPMSVISNWTTQFQEHVEPNLDLHLYLYYGLNRVKDVEFLQTQDVVLTTYNTLASDFRQGNSSLHQIDWLRVVLDEGHVIRNARSSQSVATVALHAKRRWVLTGTPIQNRMTDLWTMLKFLRFEPFTDKAWWRDILLLPNRNRGPGSYNRINKLMMHLAIRRLKTDLIDGKPIVELPAKQLIIEEITLEGEQKRKYDMMQNQGKLTLSRLLKRGIKCVLRNYAHMLVIIMRLRQLCCHPWLCKDVVREMEHAVNVCAQLEQWQQQDNADADVETDEKRKEDENRLIEQLLQVLEAGDSEECAVCLDNLRNAVITRCAHVFCFDCIVEVINTQESTLCPLCRAAIAEDQLIKVPEKKQNESIAIPDDDGAENEADEEWESSAKVDALMTSLVEVRDEDPSVKSIIVSQFTSFLNLIQIQLRRRRFHYTRIDGSMNQKSRAEAIDAFNDRSEESPTIMLLSMNAGGVGLTLTAASRVYLMDPAWNPAIEEQCFNRCHRLGQTKDVTIIKYVVRETIEERMLELQEKKRELMQTAFGSSKQTEDQVMQGRIQELGNLIGLF